MATETVPLDNLQIRLQAVMQLNQAIARMLNSAKAVLEDDDSHPVNDILACTLGQLGWMADRAAAIAGDDSPLGGAEPETWMLDTSLRELLIKKGL